jgi:hypothetical protein
MKILKIRTVYGGLVYVRDEDHRRSEERSFVKICKRDGAYHKEQRNVPCRLLHKDNVRQITVLESAPWTQGRPRRCGLLKYCQGRAWALLYPVARSHSVS